MPRTIARANTERASATRQRVATGVFAILIPASGAFAAEELFGPPSPYADEPVAPAVDADAATTSSTAIHVQLTPDIVRPVVIMAELSAFDGCRLPSSSDGLALDPICAVNLLQRRYRELQDHHERGQLVEEIDLGDGTVRRTETQVDCYVRDGRFTVSTTARRIRTFFGRMVPVRTGPGVEAAAQELDRWIVPHAMLDRDTSSMLDASAADTVRVADRELIRLEFEDDGDRVELFVNPETVLVERARAERTLPNGGRWRGELDIQTVGEVPPFDAAIAEFAASSAVAEEVTFTAEEPSIPAPAALPVPESPVAPDETRFRD